MIIKYKYGFEFEGKIYGWKDKKLYKLPQLVNNRSHSLLECKVWKRGGKTLGFFLGKKMKSFNQLDAMTHYINKEIELIRDSDVPF